MDGSGSPLVSSCNGVVLADVAGGMNVTETEVGEMVDTGRSV